MSLAGCPSGKFSLAKQNSSVSSSGPDITSYPIDTNRSSISSITIFIGFLLPFFTFFPGSVISIVSADNFLFNSICLNSDSFSDINFSNSSLTSFTKLPITGLSSGDSAPIPLNTDVNSPFFPKNFTLVSPSVFKSEDFFISSIAVCLICSI